MDFWQGPAVSGFMEQKECHQFWLFKEDHHEAQRVLVGPNEFLLYCPRTVMIELDFPFKMILAIRDFLFIWLNLELSIYIGVENK